MLLRDYSGFVILGGGSSSTIFHSPQILHKNKQSNRTAKPTQTTTKTRSGIKHLYDSENTSKSGARQLLRSMWYQHFCVRKETQILMAEIRKPQATIRSAWKCDRPIRVSSQAGADSADSGSQAVPGRPPQVLGSPVPADPQN